MRVMKKSIKVTMISLGCSKNLVDSEVMLGLLAEAGYQLTGDESRAEAIIVNTCGFIDSAKEEAIETILTAAGNKKTGSCRALVVAGCLAQRYGTELLAEMPEIDAVLGAGEIEQVVDVLKRALDGERPLVIGESTFIYSDRHPRIVTTPGHYAYVKVAEGCDNRCSFCAIPMIRGRFRSRPIESIVSEVERLQRDGFKEINLIAQDTTSYGKDLYGHGVLPELIQKITELEGEAWIRILYGYPGRFEDKILEQMAVCPRVCPYVDMPMQHVGRDILRSMNRWGDPEILRREIRRIREAVPGVTIRSSFIVGLPGETDRDFEEMMDFLMEMKLDRVGIFAYSPQEGTPAGSFPNQVPEEVRLARYNRAMQLQQAISNGLNSKKVGQVFPVLIEGVRHNSEYALVGRSQGDAPDVDGLVFIETDSRVEPGEIIPVRITQSDEYDLYGVDIG